MRKSLSRLKDTVLLGFVLFCMCACKEQIVHNLSESESNRLLSTLSDSAIKAEKLLQRDGTWAIAVDKAQSIQAIKLLNDRRLLRDKYVEQASSASIISSREDQRFRFERALSREIESTLLAIPKILEARVHLNLPPLDPFFSKKTDESTGSASVLLVVSEAFKIDSEIAAIVAGASGIPVDTVRVLVQTNRQENQRSTGTEQTTASSSNLGKPLQISTLKWLNDLARRQGPIVIAFLLISLGIASLFFLFRATGQQAFVLKKAAAAETKLE